MLIFFLKKKIIKKKKILKNGKNEKLINKK